MPCRQRDDEHARGEGRREEEERAGNPGGRRDRSDQLEDRHAPVAEGLRPAQRDAERIANDRAGGEADRPQAQRVADADQKPRPFGDVDVEKPIRRREEGFGQPAKLRRRQLPQGEPDPDRDKPRPIVDPAFAEPAQARDDKRQHDERQCPARHDDGEETIASPRHDIRQSDGRDCRRRPCDGGDKPACPNILMETA